MWRRRELLGVLGTSAAGLAWAASRSEAAQIQAPVPDPRHSAHDPKHGQMLNECAEACGHCEATCNQMFHHCLMLAGQGKTQHAKMAQIAADCAAFCTLSAAMIARHSALMVESCRACGEACRRCAEECGSSTEVDDMTKTCITACRRCEESCRNMVRAMGGEHHHEHTSERAVEKR